MGGTGGGLVYNVEELRIVASRGLSASMVGPDSHRGIRARLGGAGAGSRPRRQEPDDHGLLHRERGRDGRAYRRFLLRRADADDRSQAPGEAAGLFLPHRRGHRRHRRHEHPVSRTTRRRGASSLSRSTRATSRSSALASKATGFPIALVSAKLAGGLTMDEIPYWRDGTLEKYTPSGDYVVVKFSRWAFEKFKGSIDRLGTQMRAVGEVMSIGKTYKEAFQKAIRSLENGRHGLGFAKDFHQRPLAELMTMLQRAEQRAAVDHVRGAAQRRFGGGTLRQDLHQAVVHPADEGAGRAGGTASQAQGPGAARPPAHSGQAGRFSPTST